MLRNRTTAWRAWVTAAMLGLSFSLTHAQAAKAPDVLIKEVSMDVLDALRADKSIKQGDVQRVISLVDQKVMPHVDFQRMTSASVGRYWREATPEQQKQLQEQFKILLVRTYSGALAQVQDQTVELKPSRSSPDDKEVVVRTEVKGRGDPIQLDYRLEQTPNGWKIYDVNVLGVWLVQSYRSSFAQEIGTNGVDGLIKKLAERNARPTPAPAPAKS
jgi:phospholipid transport system substrate-binding protein